MNKTYYFRIAVFGLLAFAAGIGVGLFVFIQKPTVQNTYLGFLEKASDFSNLIPPLCVMIENEVKSRPYQVGLSEAKIVYEAPTEGNITRFLAIFPATYEKKLGPVRSIRTYFLDWAHEYKCVLAHVGGNSDALARLTREKIFNADQFFYEKYFRRENVGHTALEHTMFTDGKELEKLAEDEKWIWEAPLKFLRKNVGAEPNFAAAPEATNIFLDFGLPSYSIHYEYDPFSKKYLRSQAKKPHIDTANNQTIAPSVIVVQRVKSWSNGDSKGSISIQTIGEGEAYVFEKGRVIQAMWKKTALEEPTEFFDTLGNEISFASDPVWIEILPVKNSFSYE